MKDKGKSYKVEKTEGTKGCHAKTKKTSLKTAV